jgi:hypothetical protein
MCKDCNSIAEMMGETNYQYCPMCGEQLVPPNHKYSKTYWEYVDTLEQYSDEWRRIIDLGQLWHSQGLDLDECIKDIIKG